MDTPCTLADTQTEMIERSVVVVVVVVDDDDDDDDDDEDLESANICPCCNIMLIALHVGTHQCSSESSESGWGHTEALCSTRKVAWEHPDNTSSPEAKSSMGRAMLVLSGDNVWWKKTKKQKQKNPVLPSPTAWGWKQDGKIWKPLWTTLQPVQQSCYELIWFLNKAADDTANLPGRTCNVLWLLCDCGGDCSAD